MNRILIALLFSVVPLSSISAQTQVAIPAIPATVEDFVALRDRIATTPHGGAACFVVALYIYTQNQPLGLQCLTTILANNTTNLRASQGGGGYQGFEPTSSLMYYFQHLLEVPWTANSYFLNTAATNGYALPATLTVQLNTNSPIAAGATTARIFVVTTGGNMPRPLAMEVNNRGIWKVTEFSSLVIGVSVPPTSTVDDAL